MARQTLERAIAAEPGSWYGHFLYGFQFHLQNEIQRALSELEIAVFDKDYDAPGPYPEPPKLKAGQPARRTPIVYNDAFAGEGVEVPWRAVAGEQEVESERRTLKIPLGFTRCSTSVSHLHRRVNCAWD